MNSELLIVICYDTLLVHEYFKFKLMINYKKYDQSYSCLCKKFYLTEAYSFHFILDNLFISNSNSNCGLLNFLNNSINKNFFLLKILKTELYQK